MGSIGKLTYPSVPETTFPVFIMYRFFAEIPDSLIESARLDGAREWQLLWYIALPMGSSGIIAALVLGFLEYWILKPGLFHILPAIVRFPA